MKKLLLIGVVAISFSFAKDTNMNSTKNAACFYAKIYSLCKKQAIKENITKNKDKCIQLGLVAGTSFVAKLKEKNPNISKESQKKVVEAVGIVCANGCMENEKLYQEFEKKCKQ